MDLLFRAAFLVIYARVCTMAFIKFYTLLNAAQLNYDVIIGI